MAAIISIFRGTDIHVTGDLRFLSAFLDLFDKGILQWIQQEVEDFFFLKFERKQPGRRAVNLGSFGEDDEGEPEKSPVLLSTRAC